MNKGTVVTLHSPRKLHPFEQVAPLLAPHLQGYGHYFHMHISINGSAPLPENKVLVHDLFQSPALDQVSNKGFPNSMHPTITHMFQLGSSPCHFPFPRPAPSPESTRSRSHPTLRHDSGPFPDSRIRKMAKYSAWC